MADYDKIAEKYDEFFGAEKYRKEDLEVAKMLPKTNGRSVLDIGCGTGLAYELYERMGEKHIHYCGVDPSGKMLEKFKAKYPKVVTVQNTFEGMAILRKYDIAVSLYNSPNYIEPKAIIKLKDILTENGYFFLMFAKDEYEPIAHTLTNEKVAINKFSEFKPYLEKISKNVVFNEYHNYIIARGNV